MMSSESGRTSTYAPAFGNCRLRISGQFWTVLFFRERLAAVPGAILFFPAGAICPAVVFGIPPIPNTGPWDVAVQRDRCNCGAQAIARGPESPVKLQAHQNGEGLGRFLAIALGNNPPLSSFRYHLLNHIYGSVEHLRARALLFVSEFVRQLLDLPGERRPQPEGSLSAWLPQDRGPSR